MGPSQNPNTLYKEGISMNKVILSGRLVKDSEVRIDVGPNKIAMPRKWERIL